MRLSGYIFNVNLFEKVYTTGNIFFKENLSQFFLPHLGNISFSLNIFLTNSPYFFTSEKSLTSIRLRRRRLQGRSSSWNWILQRSSHCLEPPWRNPQRICPCPRLPHCSHCLQVLWTLDQGRQTFWKGTRKGKEKFSNHFDVKLSQFFPPTRNIFLHRICHKKKMFPQLTNLWKKFEQILINFF